MTILVVNQSLGEQRILEEALSPVGHDMDLAGTLAEARQATRARSPDLVVLGAVLPDGHCVEFLRELRQNNRTRDVIALLLCSESELPGDIRDVPAGANTFLGERYELSEVTSRVRALLADRRGPSREELLARLAEKNRKLASHAEDLRRLTSELETFTHSLSHDMRQPLRAIDGFSRAIQDRYEAELDDQGKHYLRRIRDGVLHMGSLIDGLSTLSRVSRAQLTIQDVSIGRVAKKICERLRGAHPDRQASVTIEEDLRVQADPSLMELALSHLLDNAWKFTSKVRQARIEVRRSADQPDVYMVRDNGAGFDMRYAGRLFGPFQRLHTQGEFEGMGIGLATVKRIIHRHGGRVWAESQPDVGTTIFFTVPWDSSNV